MLSHWISLTRRKGTDKQTKDTLFLWEWIFLPNFALTNNHCPFTYDERIPASTEALRAAIQEIPYHDSVVQHPLGGAEHLLVHGSRAHTADSVPDEGDTGTF